MDRKYGKKTKKNVKSRRKGRATIIEEDTDLHASLSDSIFKDSFDKFLGDRGDRRKQLNLKQNVRASFNRDSSFELSTISEPDSTASSVDLPLKATNTVCSTPNVKFSNKIGTLTTPRNDSSDLFASYAGFELNGSQESVTKSQLNSQGDSTQNDESDNSALTSNVQLVSANSSAKEEIDFFKRLRKRPMRDLRSALVNSLTFSKRMSSSHDMSVDSVEAKSSIDQINADSDRYGSYIEISSLLTDSAPCDELPELSDQHSSNGFNIKLEDVTNVSAPHSSKISSREPRFSRLLSIATQTVMDAGNCSNTRRGLRRTILEMMKQTIDSSEKRRMTALKKSVTASPSNRKSVSPQNTPNSTNAQANDCNSQTQYSENVAASYHSPDFHSIASPFCNVECDITPADSVDDVSRCIKHEQHESSDEQMPADIEDDKTITRTILEIMKEITESSESKITNASADSVDDIFHCMDHESTDPQTMSDVENNKSIRRSILQIMKLYANSTENSLLTASGNSVCLTTDNLSSNSVSGVSSANLTQTESSNDTFNPCSNLVNTNTDQSIATSHSNNKRDITAADHSIEQPNKTNVIQTTPKERADINVSKRRRCNFKRLVTPVKSSDNIVSSQYVVTRKKAKLFDTTGPNIHNVSNTTVIETISSEDQSNDTRMRKASAIPSSLVQKSTVTNEVESSKKGATDPRLSPREHLRDIGNTINCINVTKRKRHLLANTLHLPAINESSENDQVEDGNAELFTSVNEFKGEKANIDNDLHSLTLHPGKWRRSISLYRRHSKSMRTAFLLEQTDVESINSLKISLSNESNRQRLRHSVSFNLSRDNYADLNETSDRRAARRRRTSVVNPYVDAGRLTEFDFRSTYEARDTILRKCGQSEPLEFADVYSQGALRHCRKIGEGVYGEVFMNKTDAGRAIVLKIIPIEGTLEVNGEPQKKFDEVLSEIVIALQLSSLRNDKEYMTSSFAEVVQVRCVQGRYPNHLIDLWELYRDNYQTENDHPEIFGDDQLYIVFELANGGQDLEAFQFANALQAKSSFQQMALALAIAEKKLQFEHRDLHWGNILLSPTDEKFVNFKFNGNILQIPSEGIKVTIIDYTLSRMLYDGIVLYNDLSNDDELFTAHGDYQFDIYRLMKSNLENDWQRFVPFNNILWLHYIVDKLINGARYKNTKSRKHRLAIEDLMVIRDEITNYKSAVDSVSII